MTKLNYIYKNQDGEYFKSVEQIIELVKKEIIGEDVKQNPNYSIMNPFRRMEEDVREHINSFKRKQRERLEK